MSIAKKSSLLLLSVIVLCSLSGCGSDWPHKTKTAVAPSGPSGRITKGPVVGAIVYADSLTSGTRFIQDATEVWTTTDANGDFQLPTVPSYSHILVSAGGTDKISGQPAIQMIAPAGSKNVTPLTTLVALDTTGTVKAKIEALLPAGANFDTDISTTTSQAAILLAKSVETAVQTVAKAISTDAAGSVTTTQLAAIQTEVMKDVSSQIAAMPPATATATLSTPSSLTTVISTAVTTSATTISNDTASFANITITPAAVTTAAATVATAVTSTATAIVGAANLNTTATTTAVTGGEAAVITPAAVTAINTAVTTAVTTIAADTGLTTTATPTNYTPPAVTVVVAPTVTANSPAAGAAVTGGSTSIAVSFSEAMLNSATDPASAANPANWVITAGSSTVTPSAITYNAATNTFTAAVSLPNGASVTVIVKAGIKSAATSPGSMVNNYTWTFTTKATGITGGTGGSL